MHILFNLAMCSSGSIPLRDVEFVQYSTDYRFTKIFSDAFVDFIVLTFWSFGNVPESIPSSPFKIRRIDLSDIPIASATLFRIESLFIHS